MGAISFFLKTLTVTIVMVLLMQVKVGSNTIEEHTVEFIATSGLVKPIDDTANNAVRVIRNGLNRLSKAVSGNFNRAQHGETQSTGWSLRFPVVRNTTETGENTASQGRRISSDTMEAVRSRDTRGILQKFKDKAISTQQQIRSRFIDETKVPGENQSRRAAASAEGSASDPTRASALGDSEDLIEDQE